MEVRSGALSPLRLLAVLGVASIATAVPFEFSNCYSGEGDFFQFGTGGLDAEWIPFNQFKGKVMIALNVASF